MSLTARRIVIVGGGITGLAAAHRITELAEGRSTPISVTLLESSSRLGGVIKSERTGGFVLELGPDSILSEKPWARDLAVRIGLQARMIPTQEQFRGTYVVRAGRLVRLPEGFLMMAPTQIGAFLRSPIFSWRGKARMALDLVLPRGNAKDESLASFVRRRFGREALDRVVQPLVGGIYTADPERLSLAATMPRFLEMERRHRSVIKAMWLAQRRAPAETSGARWSLFFNFDSGTQLLVDTLEQRLAAIDRRLDTPVLGLERSDGAWQVTTAQENLRADAVLLALPSHRTAPLLHSHDATLATELSAIRWSSAAVVLLAYRAEDVPNTIDGFGFVVPLAERRRIIAGSYSSRKYPGRAPSDHCLLRIFVGGFGHETAWAADDAAMLAGVRAEVAELLGIHAAPVLCRVQRWPDSMPQYDIGHLPRVARIEQRCAAIPGLALAGASYRGVGIPDCVRDGETAAERLVASLQDRASA